MFWTASLTAIAPKKTSKIHRTMQQLQYINACESTPSAPSFEVSYQIFGQTLHTAPIVLVHHALTGNSQVAGEKGWWNRLIGAEKTIDLRYYTVIAFNIPGNGYQNEHLLSEQKKIESTKTVAELFWSALDRLAVTELFAIIGGSLGGAIAWEMAFLRPKSMLHLIPIATSLQASDWLVANVMVQEKLLKESALPIEIARMHAMLLYRTPESLTQKFNKAWDRKAEQYQVENWLNHHGKALQQRFSIKAYQRMNHLLRTIGQHLTPDDLLEFAQNCSAHIHCIAINSDYLFTYKEQTHWYQQLKKHKKEVDFYTIDSMHGHDAFLIEYDQLNHLLTPIFRT